MTYDEQSSRISSYAKGNENEKGLKKPLNFIVIHFCMIIVGRIVGRIESYFLHGFIGFLTRLLHVGFRQEMNFKAIWITR